MRQSAQSKSTKPQTRAFASAPAIMIALYIFQRTRVWHHLADVLTRPLQLVMFFIMVSALASCVRLPEADEAATGPQIDHLVRRVKCDLYQAFAEPLSAPEGYEWLRTWTAQANLNLIVTDQSQLTPGAVLTTPMRAVTVPLVVTNFAQSFNIGLGAQLNNTATRNETIMFSVSMDELTHEFGSHPDSCLFPDHIDLQSELGIKEWITQSLSPVDHHFLDIGYHKPPKSGTGAAAATVAKAIKDVGLALSNLNFGPTISTSKGITVVGPKMPDCVRPNLRNRELSIRAVIQMDLAVVTCDLFTFQPGPPLPTAPPPTAPAPSAPPPAPSLTPPEHDLQNLDGRTVAFVVKTIHDIQRTIRDLMVWGDVTKKSRVALENTAIALSVFVDPPVDTLSHQAQFIIATNASASPSWTLLRFKGPSPTTGSLVSLTKTRTHTLNLVIGPPGSSDAQGALVALQTGTALTNALSTSPISIISH